MMDLFVFDTRTRLELFSGVAMAEITISKIKKQICAICDISSDNETNEIKGAKDQAQSGL